MSMMLLRLVLCDSSHQHLTPPGSASASPRGGQHRGWNTHATSQPASVRPPVRRTPERAVCRQRLSPLSSSHLLHGQAAQVPPASPPRGPASGGFCRAVCLEPVCPTVRAPNLSLNKLGYHRLSQIQQKRTVQTPGPERVGDLAFLLLLLSVPFLSYTKHIHRRTAQELQGAGPGCGGKCWCRLGHWCRAPLASG